jgi:hypothetical protein
MGGLRAEVKARDLSNMKRECYPLVHVFRNTVVRVPGYRSTGLGFVSRRYQIF